MTSIFFKDCRGDNNVSLVERLTLISSNAHFASTKVIQSNTPEIGIETGLIITSSLNVCKMQNTIALEFEG